jgi:hypothetical protein
MIGMQIAVDSHVIDVLMPDLVGHDRKASAFVVYLYLLRLAMQTRRGQVGASLQSIATRTGLSKSSVQGAIRHLKRRGLLGDAIPKKQNEPVRVVLRPWQSR